MSDPAAGAALEVRVDASAGLYDDGHRRVRLAPEPVRRAHVYNLLYTTLVRSLGRYYLLHGAAVSRDGRAWLVSGPSGSGKTTVGRALAARGFDLMTDDLAPLAVDTALLHPFPRRLGVERGAAEGADDYVRVGDKDFVSAEVLGLSLGSEPLPPAGVVLMSPYRGSGRDEIRLRIGVLPGAGGLAGALAGLPGVTVREEAGPGGIGIVSATLEAGADMAAVSRVLERLDDQVLFHGRDPIGPRRWAGSPEIEPIPVREAATALLRETLNREPGGALMKRLGGRLAAALVELAGLLDGVRCWRLRPAGQEETADALAGLLS